MTPSPRLAAPAPDRLPVNPHYLRPLFEPASVALVGASERPGKIGSVVLENLLSAGFDGDLFAVNPKYSVLRGLPCVP